MNIVLELTAANLTTVLVEQNAMLALRVCKRVYVLDDGKNVHEGTAEEMLADGQLKQQLLGIWSANETAEEKQYADELLDRGVDGLIICSALRNDPVVNELRKRGVPFVLALRRIDEGTSDQPVDFVGVDDRRGAAMMTEHLLKMGHTCIALISGPQEISTGYYR